MKRLINVKSLSTYLYTDAKITTLKYHTLSDIATLLNTAAIFKNGGCECRISPNMYTLSLMLMFYVKLFMKYRKASFYFRWQAF